MPKKVWLVVGETGEGDSRREWNVAAYHSENDAILHCDLANKKAKELGIGEYLGNIKASAVDNLACKMMPLDFPSVDYTGVWYSTTYVEVLDKVPE